MELALAGEQDVPLLLEIYKEARLALADLGIDQWQNGYPSSDMVEEDVRARNTRIVIADDGEIAGCALYAVDGEPDYDEIEGSWLTDSCAEAPDYIVVHRVAVGANHARQGIGSYAIAGALMLAEEMNRASVRIDTHPGNVRMRHMLEKLGFAECGIITISEAGGTSPYRIAYEKLIEEN